MVEFNPTFVGLTAAFIFIVIAWLARRAGKRSTLETLSYKEMCELSYDDVLKVDPAKLKNDPEERKKIEVINIVEEFVEDVEKWKRDMPAEMYARYSGEFRHLVKEAKDHPRNAFSNLRDRYRKEFGLTLRANAKGVKV